MPILRQKADNMSATINGIPLFEALIDDFETGMLCISLVEAPAVESNFLAFDNDKRVPLYCVANEEKHIVRGVVARANFPIYRRSAEEGEYYITFSAETIRLMAEKYLYEHRQDAVTLHHIAGANAEGINLVQYFIKDTAQGIAPLGFEDIADGSLFAEFQVHDDYLWEQIKAGTFKGFSLEGVFAVQRVETQPNQNNMSKMQKFKEALAKLVGETFAQVVTDKGTLRWESDEDLKAGDEVFYINENGEPVKPEDGDYKTEDGKVIRVEDGKVVEIVDDKAEVSDEGAEETPEDEPRDERDERNDHEERIVALEGKFADLEARVAEVEERIAKAETQEALSAVKEDVAELREALSKTAPKGIAEKFEETPQEIDRIAALAKLRDEAIK